MICLLVYPKKSIIVFFPTIHWRIDVINPFEWNSLFPITSLESFKNDVNIDILYSFNNDCSNSILLVGTVASPRPDPSKTLRTQTAPGYRILVDHIPNQDQTMVSQRFNKLSPFVTEHGNNPNANPVLREFSASTWTVPIATRETEMNLSKKLLLHLLFEI